MDATVVNMRFVKPLDEGMVREIARSHELLVTVDEKAVQGGAGSAVNEVLAGGPAARPVLNLGLPDRFIEHGSRSDMLTDAGLDAAGIEARVNAWIDGLAAEHASAPRVQIKG
jgi:1-deoxy-D-xylulose-5-phosphate synthase